VDGDTVDLLVDLGFTILVRTRFRLLGIDTPETNRRASREAGLAAQSFAESLAPLGSEVLVRSHKTGEYGRWLAEICPLDERGDPLPSVNEALVEAGHAERYPG
jgi:endonuclease YncB( thermonuclease family)